MSIVYWKPIGNKPNEPKQKVYQYGQQLGNANDKKHDVKGKPFSKLQQLMKVGWRFMRPKK